jgi:hypothetical protein
MHLQWRKCRTHEVALQRHGVPKLKLDDELVETCVNDCMRQRRGKKKENAKN